MKRVLWMPSALEDLQSIREYIARDSAYYADKFVDEAFNATERLESFPNSGRVVPEMDVETIREIIYGSYRIVYEIMESDVHVVAVIHGKRVLPDTL